MYHCDENILLWWNYITVIKFITLMIYHIYHLVIRGLITKLTNFAFLHIANFGHFDTFPDGMVGVWVGWNSILKTMPAKLKLKLRAKLGKILQNESYQLIWVNLIIIFHALQQHKNRWVGLIKPKKRVNCLLLWLD